MPIRTPDTIIIDDFVRDFAQYASPSSVRYTPERTQRAFEAITTGVPNITTTFIDTYSPIAADITNPSKVIRKFGEDFCFAQNGVIILEITPTEFVYRGKRIQDAGKAHMAFIDAMKILKVKYD